MVKINLQTFFADKQLFFESKRQGIAWVKRNLKPRSLIRIGPNYLVDEKEITKLFNEYVRDQQELSETRAKRAKTLHKKRKLKINEPPQ